MGLEGLSLAMTMWMQRRQKMWRHRVMTGAAMSLKQMGHSSSSPACST